ncbi:hypothetical protein [Salinimicrobium sp. HB62]|uniref:hypothetical protein n=1 Tax=Salinimicrobium sp. HB62 TaxID=3077781 RepID=UPI002D78FB27|nr:hypothetical protein [Salinimicrobium sp. HB62]
MKNLKWMLTLTFLLALQIYASPVDNNVELAATFCHFSETGLRCSCPEEARENRIEEKRTARKLRQQKKRNLLTCIR